MDMFLVFLSLVDIFLLKNGENKVKNAAHLKYVKPNIVTELFKTCTILYLIITNSF